nr:ribonuclease H-like domain-containing protein [Tanacetum cinerariifolium]
MHAPLKSHFDIALRLLKYLKLAPGFGVHFVKRQSGFDIKAFSNSDWAKCPVTRRSVSAYYVFVNAATCEIMWIVKIISDLNIKNLLPAELYCDNKAALQIAANPVMHEKTKHFDLDVHFIKEKVHARYGGQIRIRREEVENQLRHDAKPVILRDLEVVQTLSERR